MINYAFGKKPGHVAGITMEQLQRSPSRKSIVKAPKKANELTYSVNHIGGRPRLCTECRTPSDTVKKIRVNLLATNATLKMPAMV